MKLNLGKFKTTMANNPQKGGSTTSSQKDEMKAKDTKKDKNAMPDEMKAPTGAEEEKVKGK